MEHLSLINIKIRAAQERLKVLIDVETTAT
jgi:hypothetical protein